MSKQVNKKEYLQNLADTQRTDCQYEFEIEFRGRGGWYAIPDEARWVFDNGEYLGQDWKAAEKALRSLLG